jgi:predicted alpha/beta superfamily hydrolase
MPVLCSARPTRALPRLGAVFAMLLPFVPAAAIAQPPAAATPAPVLGPPLGKTGLFKRHPNFPSRYVEPRLIEVWLPPDYLTDDKSYPVLYVHDGQSVFDPATAFGGVDWGLDETMTRLIAEKRIRPAIVVAIANTAKRFQEYLPRKALVNDSAFATGLPSPATLPGPVLSDAYLRFITTELKPFIDQTYRTKRERDDTFIMGSSMGGLISLYAINELPGIFGGAACLSTHWPAAGGATLDYLRRGVAKASEHRIYFDHGTATLDSLYAPYQEQVDAIMRAHRYEDGEHFMTRVFDGADHSERSWRQRLDIPLVFLLKR